MGVVSMNHHVYVEDSILFKIRQLVAQEGFSVDKLTGKRHTISVIFLDIELQFLMEYNGS